MNDTEPNKAVSIEPVAIGERQTRISAALVVVLCVIPSIATILFGGVDSITWVLLTLLTFVVIVLWSLETWRAKGLLLNTNTLLLPLGAIVALGFLQIILGTSQNPFATKIFVGRIAIFIVYFAACLTFVNTEKRLRRIVVFLLVFAALMAFVGILQKLADPDAIFGIRSYGQGLPFGPFVNGHHFATFMEMTGGLALGLLFGTLKRDRKLLVGVAFGLILLALVLTGSRGAMLSFLVVTGVCLIVRAAFRTQRGLTTPDDEISPLQRKVTVIAAVAAIVIGVIGAIIFIGGDESLIRGVGLSQGMTDASNGRIHFWSIAIRIFLEHPLLGAGLDAYSSAFAKHDTWIGYYRVEFAHNEYLQALSDGGVVGLAIVVGFLYLLVRKALAFIKSATGFRRDAAIGAFAGCCGSIVHSFFDFPLRTWSNAFFFLLLVAIATVAVRPEGETRTHKRRKRRSSEHEQRSPSTRTATRT